MMQAIRSLSALDEKTLRRSSDRNDASATKDSTEGPKPFFIMDWLEELAGGQDMEKIAKLLKTPTKQKSSLPMHPHHYHHHHPQHIDGRDDGVDPYHHQHHQHHLSADPTTPKSSNRKKPPVLATSTSCPTLLSRSRSVSPVRPTQLLFGVFARSQEQDPETSITDASDTTTALPQRRIRRPRSPHSIYRKSIAMGNAWNAKGLAKAQQGLWAEALGCWDNALEIRVHLLGRNHLDVANIYNNRGIALGKVGRTAEALESLQTALEIRWHLWEHSTDKSYDPILSTLHNMANVHQQAGNLQQALQVFGQARELGNRQVNNMPMARICVAMGHVYYQAEHWVDARDAYLDALQLYRAERRLQQLQVKQQQQLQQEDDLLTAAILTCQQELADVERDIHDLDRRLMLQKMILPTINNHHQHSQQQHNQQHSQQQHHSSYHQQ